MLTGSDSNNLREKVKMDGATVSDQKQRKTGEKVDLMVLNAIIDRLICQISLLMFDKQIFFLAPDK